MLGDALAEQRRLVELLDGLQALARGDAGPLERTEVDLARGRRRRVGAAVARHPGSTLSAELPEAPVADRAAGSRACGCSSTTSSRTPSATAAPTARCG